MANINIKSPNNMLRKARMRNLSSELLAHRRLTLTHTVARQLQSYFERLITIAKVDSVARRRSVAKLLRLHHPAQCQPVKTLFQLVAQRYQTVAGGYTRILKMKYRRGDGALLVSLQLT